MKTIIPYALLILFVLNCDLPNKESKAIKFTQKTLDLSIPGQKKEFDDWVNANVLNVGDDTIAKKYESESRYDFVGETKNCYFEDRDFEVYSECAGEWGGSLFFIDKKNREKIYHFPSICPKMVDSKEGKYLITSTLAHMSGSAEIAILENPRQLPLFQRSTSKDKFKEKLMMNMLQTPIPENVVERILDTSGITVNIYYPYQNRHFVIFSEYQTSYLGEIQSGKIVNKEPLLNYGIWGHEHKLNKIRNRIYISEIDKRSTSFDPEQSLKTIESLNGTIYIKEDTIVIGYKYEKRIEKE